MISYMIFAAMNYYTMRKVAKESGFSMKALDIKMLLLIFIAFTAVCFIMMATYKLIVVRYAIVLAGAIAAVIKRRELMKFVNNTVKHK